MTCSSKSVAEMIGYHEFDDHFTHYPGAAKKLDIVR